jgi:hypothetical protein
MQGLTAAQIALPSDCNVNILSTMNRIDVADSATRLSTIL